MHERSSKVKDVRIYLNKRNAFCRTYSPDKIEEKNLNRYENA